MTFGFLRAASVLAPVFVLGCAGIPHRCKVDEKKEATRYLLVDWVARAEHAAPPAPQVQESPEYATKRAAIATVTVRVSDECSAASVTSTPDATCAAWAEAITGALGAGGIHVVRWSEYQAALKGKTEEARVRAEKARIEELRQPWLAAQRAEKEARDARGKKKAAAPAEPVPEAPPQTATVETTPNDPRLAVQAVVVVDAGSLSVEGGATAEELRYFVSNAAGAVDAPASLDGETRNRLKDFVRSRVKPLSGRGTFVEARLSVSIVQPETNEMIWSYRGAEERKVARDEVEHFLFATRQGAFWPVAIQGRAQARPDEKLAEERVGQGLTPGADDPAKDVVRHLAEDAMARFRGVARGG